MNTTQQSHSRGTLLVLIATMVLCFLSSLSMMPYVPDDSYISFRYAENIVRGNGVTFNPGEQPVEGYSNLLWILLCAWLHSVGFDLPSFMPYVGALLAALNVLVLWVLLRRRELSALQMIFPLLLLGASGPFIMYAISGLETPLFSLLLLTAALWIDKIFERGRLLHYILLAVTGVLLALVRPEGIMAFPIVAVVMLFMKPGGGEPQFFKRRIKHLMIATGVFAALVVVYNIWRIGYFGEVVPTPFISKAGGGKTLFHAWGKNLEIYFFRQGDYYTPVGYYFVALAAAAFVGLSLSKSASALRRSEKAVLAMAVVYTGIYFNFKDWMPGMRYNAGLVGLFLLPAAMLPATLSTRNLARIAKTRYWLVGIAIVLLSYGLLAEQRVVTQRIEESNQKALILLGKWLREFMPNGSLLAISDVGAVPYYSGFQTIDIHPESLTDVYIAKNGFSEDYFYRRMPDVVVFPSRSIFLTKLYPEHYGVYEQARFREFYRLIGVTRYDWHNDRSYWVFVRSTLDPLDDKAMDIFPHGIGTIGRKFK